MHIKDLDVENRRSWQGALDMIFTLCGEAADLSFDCRMLGSRNKLPTVEFRLDAPAELTLPHVASTADGTVEVWKYGTVILTDHIPAQVPGIQGERAGADRAEAAGRVFMELYFPGASVR